MKTSVVLAVCGLWLGAVVSAVEGASIFSENFEGAAFASPPVALTTSNSAFTAISGDASPNSALVKSDVPSVFGFGSNYLEYADNGSTNLRIVGAAAIPANSVFQLSFDFNDPVIDNDTGFRIGLGSSAVGTTSGYTLQLIMANGSMTLVHGAQNNGSPNIDISLPNIYTTGELHSLAIVGNYNAGTVGYAGGTQSVDSNRYDVWLDGVKIADEVLFRNAFPASTSGLRITEQGSGFALAYLDNFNIQNSIAVPEPNSLVILAFSLMGLACVQQKWRRA